MKTRRKRKKGNGSKSVPEAEAKLYLKKIKELESELKRLKEGKASREYKSRLFGFIFGREENKEWTLSLYNALNGRKHENAGDLSIVTMDDVIYKGMKNDLAILVSEAAGVFFRTLELYEAPEHNKSEHAGQGV